MHRAHVCPDSRQLEATPTPHPVSGIRQKVETAFTSASSGRIPASTRCSAANAAAGAGTT